MRSNSFVRKFVSISHALIISLFVTNLNVALDNSNLGVEDG